MTVSATLRQAIETSDQSRYRIAQETGLAQSALSRFINGESDLSMKAIEKLCEHFELELTKVSQKKSTKKRASPRRARRGRL